MHAFPIFWPLLFVHFVFTRQTLSSGFWEIVSRDFQRCNNDYKIINFLCWPIHTNWAESCAINPKQCKNLKFFECRKTKLVHNVEIKNDWQMQKEVTNQAFWLVNDQRNSQMVNQISCFQIKRTPWMIAWYACVSSA